MLQLVHAAAVAASGETPIPTPTMTIDPDQVTPGIAGFIGTAVIAIAVVLLLADMLRRVRRGTYRAEVREQLDAEQAAARAAEDEAGADPADAAPGRDDDPLSPPNPAKE